MKKILILFSLLFIPNFCWALDDACTKPNEYTVDKRCYVIDEQKKTKPYNAVVGLVDDSAPYCTGTVVRYENKLYIYTAKHCVIDGDNISAQELKVKLQDGRTFNVSKNNIGDYYREKVIKDEGAVEQVSKNGTGDWAIYNVPQKEKNISSVHISGKTELGVGVATLDYDARLIGYGSLKIMSDAEIKEFKQKYIDYLKTKLGDDIKGTETGYGFGKDGVWMKNEFVKKFIYNLDASTYLDIFNDKDLKVSNCIYSSNGKKTHCQSWYGDSGGGIFDEYGDIMGINTKGFLMIGGSHHAGTEGRRMIDVGGTGSVLLLDGLFMSNKIKPN